MSCLVVDLPNSISAARKAEAKLYYTGKLCSRGHDSPRLAVSGLCVACNRENSKACYLANPAKRVAEAKAWAEKNKAHDAYLRKLRKQTPKYKEAAKRWQQISEVRAKHTARVRARQLRTVQAMPAWVDKTELTKIYEQCCRLTDMIGVKYSVDHIVPITHSLVCGLHVPWNLQILPAWQNSAKSNNFEVG